LPLKKPLKKYKPGEVPPEMIKNLEEGLTKAEVSSLSGLENMKNLKKASGFATGGSTGGSYDPFSGGNGISNSLTPNLTKAQLNYVLEGLPGNLIGKAEGGLIADHNPEFFSEGGLGAIENKYVKGDGDGTSDSIPAMLANGEFVIPAQVVSLLGNGSNEAGASVLDEFLKTIRNHKRMHDPSKLEPDSKGPLAYLLTAQKKAKSK
jgi:hypothetical protein